MNQPRNQLVILIQRRPRSRTLLRSLYGPGAAHPRLCARGHSLASAAATRDAVHESLWVLNHRGAPSVTVFCDRGAHTTGGTLRSVLFSEDEQNGVAIVIDMSTLQGFGSRF